MPTARMCKIVDLPAEPMWELLTDYRNWGDWLRYLAGTGIEDGIKDGPCHVGAVRSVDGGRVREKSLAVDEQKLQIKYMVVGPLVWKHPIDALQTSERGPESPARNYFATVTLMPLTDTEQTVVEWVAQFDADEPDEPKIRTNFRTYYSDFIDFLEEGAAKIRATTPSRNFHLEFELRGQ